MRGPLPWLFASGVWAVQGTGEQPEILSPTLEPQYHQHCQPWASHLDSVCLAEALVKIDLQWIQHVVQQAEM